jgi:RNA polymerase sigma-70 factor (ECF subfamily)
MEVDTLTLARAKRGDARASADLVRCYEGRVFGLVGRILAGHAGPSQVEDVAQEAFLKVLKNLDRFDPAGPARLSSWIATIAARTAIDVLRSAPRLRAVAPGEALAELPAPEPDPEQAASGSELGRRVEAAMVALPAEQRAVLMLRAFSDLDYPEIASALKIEEGTVKSRLNRARAALRRVLDGDRGAST